MLAIYFLYNNLVRFNIPITILVILVFGYIMCYHILYKHFEHAKECPAHIKLNRSLTRLYPILEIVFSIMTGLFIYSNTEIYKQYNNKYNLYFPPGHFQFLRDQISMQVEDSVPVTHFNSSNFDTAGAYYDIVVTDWTPSTLNYQEQQFGTKLDSSIISSLPELHNCALYDSSLSFRKKLPLLLTSNLLQAHKVNDKKIAFIAYLGSYKNVDVFNDKLLGTKWHSYKDNKIFCDNGPSFITDYNKFVSDCEHDPQLPKEHSKIRTNFAKIVKRIKETIKEEKDLDAVDPNKYICITIISDFLHEDLFTGEIPCSFDEVEDQIRLLAQSQNIKQINLIQIPVKGYYKSKIDRLVTLFKTHFTKTYNEYINASDAPFGDDPNSVNQILAATSHYEIHNTGPVLNFYYSGDDDVSPNLNSAKLAIDNLPIEKSQYFQFRIIGDSQKSIFNVSTYKGQEFPGIVTDEWTSICPNIVSPMIFSIDKPNHPVQDHLNLVVYSTSTKTKKKVLFHSIPIVSRESAVWLIILYSFILTGMLFIAACYLFYLCMHILYPKPIRIFLFFISLSCVLSYMAMLSYFIIDFYRSTSFISYVLFLILIGFSVIAWHHGRILSRIRCPHFPSDRGDGSPTGQAIDVIATPIPRRR